LEGVFLHLELAPKPHVWVLDTCDSKKGNKTVSSVRTRQSSSAKNTFVSQERLQMLVKGWPRTTSIPCCAHVVHNGLELRQQDFPILCNARFRCSELQVVTYLWTHAQRINWNFLWEVAAAPASEDLQCATAS
jgi:hypothetical protein